VEVKDERSVVVSRSTILVVVVASTSWAVVAVVVSNVCVVAAVDLVTVCAGAAVDVVTVCVVAAVVVAVVRCNGRIVTEAEKNLKMRYCLGTNEEKIVLRWNLKNLSRGLNPPKPGLN